MVNKLLMYLTLLKKEQIAREGKRPFLICISSPPPPLDHWGNLERQRPQTQEEPCPPHKAEGSSGLQGATVSREELPGIGNFGRE